MIETTSGQAGASVHRSIPRSAGVALAAILLALGLLALRQVGNTDTGFHLRAGERILSGGGWPHTDPFTFTVADRPYLDTSWGFQVLLASVQRACGPSGIVGLDVILVLATFVLLFLTARLVPSDLRVLLGLLLVAGCAVEPRFEPRPELLSWVLLALVLYLVHRHAEGLKSPLWLLPATFVVWANVHSLFVVGLGALACFELGLLVRQRRLDLRLLVWSCVSLAATLVNPYGLRALAFPLTLLTRLDRSNVFARSIGEFDSVLEQFRSDQLDFYLVPLGCTLLFLVLLALSAPALWRQKRYACLLLVLAFAPLALAMVRNVPLLVVACTPGLAWGTSLDRGLQGFRLGSPARRRISEALLWTSTIAAVVLGLRVVTDAYYIGARRLDRFGVRWNAIALPVDALAWAARAGLPGRPLNHLNFGGYLMWARREPVFIDGRLEVIGEQFYEEYRRALGSKTALEATVARYGIGWIVFPYRVEPQWLADLSHDRDWRLVYLDAVAAIFVRTAEGASVVAADGAAEAERGVAPEADFRELPGLGGGDPAPRAWLSGLYRRQVYPVREFNRGVFHFCRAEPGPAVGWFAEAIRESRGAYYEIYTNLGSTLFAADRWSEARDCYLRALDRIPAWRIERRRFLYDRLAVIDGRLGRS